MGRSRSRSRRPPHLSQICRLRICRSRKAEQLRGQWGGVEDQLPCPLRPVGFDERVPAPWGCATYPSTCSGGCSGGCLRCAPAPLPLPHYFCTRAADKNTRVGIRPQVEHVCAVAGVNRHLRRVCAGWPVGAESVWAGLMRVGSRPLMRVVDLPRREERERGEWRGERGETERGQLLSLAAHAGTP